MAVKFDKIEPGMELLDVHYERAGNTKMRRLGVWKVRVLEVDRTNFRALVSWNSNPPRWWGAAEISKLYTKLTPTQEAKLKAQRF